MLENIDAVIFDLDGTLVDSMWMWRRIDEEYLAGLGIECPDDIQKGIEGMSFTQTAHYFKERFNISDDIEKIKKDWNTMAFDKYSREVPFKDKALEFVKSLREKGIKTGIATSNSTELVEAVLKAHNAEQYFDEIHTSCEVKAGKPSPDIYLLVADTLHVKPEKCLVFEDIPAGITGGKNAGMRVCAIYDKYSEYCEDEKRSLSDYYINNFGEIMQNGL